MLYYLKILDLKLFNNQLFINILTIILKNLTIIIELKKKFLANKL